MYETLPQTASVAVVTAPPRLGLEAIVAEHGAAIARVAAAFEANAARRDELGQEILLAIWQSLPRFRGDATLKTFVLRIAHNRAVDHALRASRDLARDEVPPDLPDPQRGPEHRAGLQQRGERLARAVRHLPLAQRQLVTLALEGLSHEEIGGMLGISAGNVAVRLARARKYLSLQMGEADESR